MKLRFTPRAVANLAEIADYIHERNPAGARRVRAAIYDGERAALAVKGAAGKRLTYRGPRSTDIPF